MHKVDPAIIELTASRDIARDRFFAHHNPGNLTPSQNIAFQYRNMALLLQLNAAQLELDAEMELCRLIASESEEARWDTQIKTDSENGKLDELVAASLADFAAGHAREM